MILSSGYANEALEWTRGVLERLELTLNETKTSVRNARRERFDFLGYTFGPHYSIALKRMRTGREYIGNSPSAKSAARSKGEGRRPFGARKYGAVEASMRAAQSEVTRLASLLWMRCYFEGVPGG